MIDVLGAVLIAALIIGAFSRPARQLVGGLFQRDKRGRLVLILTPVPKSKRRRRRK